MTTAQPEPVAPLVEHFFRREAGRLVAVLTRFFGWRNFDLVEEMVQATLVDALQSWRAPRHSRQPLGLGAPRRQEQGPRLAEAQRDSAPGDAGMGRQSARAATRESTTSSSTRRSRTASSG